MSETFNSNPTVFDSAALQVPGEPGVYFCAKHKNVHTRLRCGRCEKPICPKCTQYGPTGARCGDCSSNRSSHMYQVKPLQFLLAFAVAFGLSAVAAFAIRFIGIFVLFYAPVVGTFIGKTVVSAVKGKRGTPLAIVASVGVAVGALVPLSTLLGGGLAATHLMNPFVWVYIAFAISGVWYWVR